MPSVYMDRWLLATYHAPVDSDPFVIKYDSSPFVLKPMLPTPIPEPAARLWFGDIRCRLGAPLNLRDGEGKVIGSIHSRENEVRRLRQKFGLPFGDERTFLLADGTLGVPEITLTSLDGAEEIITVLQDPLGNGTVLPGSTLPGQDAMAQIEFLAGEVRRLQAHALSDVPPDDDPDDPPAALHGVPRDEVRASTPAFANQEPLEDD